MNGMTNIQAVITAGQTLPASSGQVPPSPSGQNDGWLKDILCSVIAGVLVILIDVYMLRPVEPRTSADPAPTPIVIPTPTSLPAPMEVPGENWHYFPETGQALKGRMLDYWNEHGGEEQLGRPISPVIVELSDMNGHPYTMQYLERAVLEYHAGNQPPYDVQATLLGLFYLRERYPSGITSNFYQYGDGRFFEATGHYVGGPFLVYFDTHGGIDALGNPISEIIREVSEFDGVERFVQYFERVRLEYHTEQPQHPYIIPAELGMLRYNSKYSR